jgi:hypothetical protein
MERTLAAKRWTQQNLILGVCCLFASTFLIFQNPFLGSIGFFSGVFLLLPSSGGSLKLDREGFTYPNGLFGEKTTRWCEVSAFKVITHYVVWFIPVRRYVGWTLVSSQTSVAGKAVGWLAGFNACLPQNYGMKAAELAALLEQHRLANRGRDF